MYTFYFLLSNGEALLSNMLYEEALTHPSHSVSVSSMKQIEHSNSNSLFWVFFAGLPTVNYSFLGKICIPNKLKIIKV